MHKEGINAVTSHEDQETEATGKNMRWERRIILESWLKRLGLIGQLQTIAE